MMLLAPAGVKAQFIRFNIIIPPSFSINEQIDNSDVVDINLNSGGYNTTGQDNTAYRWLEIRTNENVLIIIESDLRSRFGMAQSPLRYLNNGGSNFTEAAVLPKTGATVPIREITKPINKAQDDPQYLSAWLGVPSASMGQLTIIYP
jgi:hypothetical protein